MASGDGQVLVGTSGWSYRSWRGPFFPEDVPARLHLEFYASRFRTTELNGVFYRTPTEEAVRGWAEHTPDDFVFAWKASKFITHWKRLNDTCRNSIELMESRLKLLRGKAGPVLFQLPPHFEKDRERLASFFKLLRAKRRYAFEFRHPSWYEDDILDLLRDHDMALCISDHHDAPSPWLATAGQSMCAAMARAAAIAATTGPTRWINGSDGCSGCSATGARPPSISTTIRRAPRRRMPAAWRTCSRPAPAGPRRK